MRNSRLAAAVLLLTLAARAYAGGEITSIKEIGPHYKLVTISKSVHRQNVLVAYTQLDEQCRIRRDPKQGNLPVFDFYWLMGGSRYKRVNAAIKSGIRKRFQIAASPPKSRDGSFSVRLGELDEVEHDLGATPLLWVRAEKTAAGCSAEARITLGPSDGGAEIRLDAIDSDAAMSGPFAAKVRSITLKGAEVATGKSVARVYPAKK